MSSTFNVSGCVEGGESFSEAFPTLDAAVVYADQAWDQHAKGIGITANGQVLASPAGLGDLLNLDIEICRACLSLVNAALKSK